MPAKPSKGKKVDEMLVGYQFPYDKDKNPYDYIDNAANQALERKGFMLHDLRRGLSNVILAPLAKWKEGDWFDTAIRDEMKQGGSSWNSLPSEADEYDTWVVDGEGTPGNWKYRMYILPQEMSRQDLLEGNVPKHPMLWPKKLKDQLEKAPAASYSSYSSSWSSSPTTTTTTTSKSSLPYGTVIRCVQCGHWFEADDLAGHLNCCPTVQGMSDWAIKCECCSSVDDTVTVKQGFPREPIVPKPKEVKDGEGDGSTERASAAADDTQGSGASAG